MREFEFDTAELQNVTNLYDRLLKALEAPGWHGHNIDALIDSMIYGGANGVEPPYLLRFTHLDEAPGEVRAEVAAMAEGIGNALEERLSLFGSAPEILFDLKP